jgi:hypothetical protein
MIREVMDQTGLARRDVVAVFDAIHASAVKGLKKDGLAVVGDVARLRVTKKPARKAGEYKNPFTGEMEYRERKPASKGVRASVVKKLKDQVA